MKQSIQILILLCLATLLGCCKDDPISSSEEHLAKLWEITLDDLVATNFIVTDSFLFYKTNNNITGKLYKVSKDGKSVQSATTGGCTLGNPVLDSSTIYTNNCESIYALKHSDLSTIWCQSIFSSAPMPVADENYVYVISKNRVFALDKSDGHPMWYKAIVGKSLANPVISGNKLYFATWGLFTDGYLYSISKTDSTEVYRIRIPYIENRSQEGGSLGGVEIWNDRIFVCGANRIFYCFNKVTGDSIWAFEPDALMDFTPRVSDGIVYFGTLNGTCYALNASTGELKWTHQEGGSVVLEPSFYQSYVMFKKFGDLLILDKKSGNEILKMGSSDFSFDSAYWDTDGKIYACGYRGSDGPGLLVAYQFK